MSIRELALPAGAVLDALLAEHLFGWTIVGESGGIIVTVMRDGRLETRPHGRYPDAPEDSLSTVPEYSASILYVGDILTAMLARGLAVAWMRLDEAGYYVSFARAGKEQAYAHAGTLAHAVALAAARALDEKDRTTTPPER